LRDGKLIAHFPGESVELVPYHGAEFTLKGKTGHSITFEQDDSGAWNQAVVNRPGATFTAHRRQAQMP
jgi:hypothetical protein